MGFETNDNGEGSGIRPPGDASARLSLSNSEMAAFQAQSKTSATDSAGSKPVYGNGWSWADAPDIYAKSADFYGKENVIAQAPERQKPLKETDPSFMPDVSMSKVLDGAKHLGADPHRWQEDTKPLGPKCNSYIDAVMKESGMPRPWGDNGAPLCAEMQEKLSKDPRYTAIWSTDYSNYDVAYKNWASFDKKPGRIYLWNTNRVTHGAISGQNNDLYYAGADAHDTHGFRHKPSDYVTGTAKAPTNYGPPSVVFSYNNLGD